MLSVALRPKNLGLLALMVLATVVCGLLANWQWNRATESMDAASTVKEAAPVPIESVLGVGDPVTNEIQGRLVNLTGHFDSSKQAVSPGREISGKPSAVIVTDFRITEGDLKGVHVPVARGYVGEPPADVAAVPTAPTETVTIVARLEASEGASEGLDHQGDYPYPVLSTISSPQLVNMWGGPMLTSYLAITDPALTNMKSADPKLANTMSAGLSPLPAADSQFSSGLNLQNFGYMIQWLLFGVFFLYIWWRTVRTQFLDEKRERRLELE